jgi:outer membrane protein OmpA-like peptidoglycan-associated protein
MNQLTDLATHAAADSNPVESAMRLASSPVGIDMSTAMAGWPSRLFGQNFSGVTNSLARYAGIRDSSASTLLLTCAPLVLGYFGRLIQSHNLTASGLAERLRAEQPHIASALPAGFEMPGIVRKPHERTRVVVDETTRREPRRERWAVPLAALLAALGLGGLLWWGMHRQPPRVNVENRVPSAVGTTGTVSRPAAPPERPHFTFPAGSIEDRLSRYLASTEGGPMKVDLDRVEFASGSSTLTPKSRAQIGDLAALLRDYPKASVVVAGHTDNVGREPANVALSQARAETVARALRNADVAADRVRAVGYGSQNPVADNSTAIGRSQNRRVTLEVTR